MSIKLIIKTIHRKRGIDRIRQSTRGAVRRKYQAHVGAKEADAATIAAYNELGTSTIPPRPFMRNAGDRHGRKWSAILEEGGKAFMQGKGDLKRSLRKAGDVAVVDIRASMVALANPPNDPDTVEGKGSSNPLVNTGRLAAAMKVEVP